MLKAQFDKITPSEILEQAANYFELIQALFEEMRKRIEPLEAANRALGSQLIDARAEAEAAAGKIGALRDANAELVTMVAAAAATFPELKPTFERLKQLVREAE